MLCWKLGARHAGLDEEDFCTEVMFDLDDEGLIVDEEAFDGIVPLLSWAHLTMKSSASCMFNARFVKHVAADTNRTSWSSFSWSAV